MPRCTIVQRFRSFVRFCPILSSNCLSSIVSHARSFVSFTSLQAITKSVLDRFMTRHGGPYAFALWSTDSCGQMFVMRITTLRAIAFLLIRIDYTREREREKTGLNSKYQSSLLSDFSSLNYGLSLSRLARKCKRPVFNAIHAIHSIPQ